MMLVVSASLFRMRRTSHSCMDVGHVWNVWEREVTVCVCVLVIDTQQLSGDQRPWRVDPHRFLEAGKGTRLQMQTQHSIDRQKGPQTTPTCGCDCDCDYYSYYSATTHVLLPLLPPLLFPRTTILWLLVAIVLDYLSVSLPPPIVSTTLVGGVGERFEEVHGGRPACEGTQQYLDLRYFSIFRS